MDWLPTLVAAAGDPAVKDKLLAGHEANGKTFKVHLDGYNFLPYLTGEEAKGPRVEFFYFSDDGDLVATRYDNWKLVFAEQRRPGHAPGLGGAVRRSCASRSCSTCARTRSSGRPRPPTPTTTGCWTACT